MRVQKNVGSEGGVVSSSDGRVQITIPEGALANETAIEVQPISNTNPAGNGLAYRLSPHGIRFQKPVRISWLYAGKEGRKKAPQLQGIAYQDESGVWKSVGNGEVDTLAQRVMVFTNHFSDWSQFETMKLMPDNTVLIPGQSISVKAVQYTGDETLLMPLQIQQGAEAVIDEPQDLPLDKIKVWRLSGVGALRPAGQQAGYKAPAMVKGNLATAAVSVELNTKQGQVLLISNITVLNEGITFRIDDGKWIYFTKKESGYHQQPNYVYANDSLHASVMINWPEKVYSCFPWSTTSEGLSPAFVFHTAWTFTNYYSTNTVGEAEEEVASPGYIEFYHFPLNTDDYVSGGFLIERGAKYDAHGKKLAEAKVEGYFYVRTKDDGKDGVSKFNF